MRSMVLKEKIASEAQRLKLKYFGDQSLEMVISAPLPPPYQSLSGGEAAEAEEDFYYKYKASDMESRKDISILESRTVRTIRNKCQPHEREKINSSSSSPNDRLITKNLESTQRERQNIRGINQKLSEGDKRLKRAKGLGSRRWDYRSVVRRKLDSSANSHPDIEGQNSHREYIFKMGRSSVNEVLTSGRTNESDSEGEGGLEQFLGFPGRAWNDNIIWLKGNCLQRDDEKLLDLQFRSVKQSVKSTGERKESLLDEVAEEETELELVMGELGLSRKKRVESRSKKVVKAQFTRSMTSVDDGTWQTSGVEVRAKTPGSGSSAQVNHTTNKIAHKFLKRQIKKALSASGTTVEERVRLAILQGKEDTSQMVAHLVKGIWPGIEEQESELEMTKSELEKSLARVKTDALKEVKQLKSAHAMAISQRWMSLRSTLAEEEVEETEVLGVLDGLDGVSPQTVLDNQGDDVELPEGGSEKVVRKMSLRINDLESRLAWERETATALLSAQVKLQVKLDASRVREDRALMCNQEFAEQFDRMNEVNENREDQYVKAHFRLEKLNQVEGKDFLIKKGLEDLSEATERAKNLQRQVDALGVKGKQANMAQYRIWALERTEDLCRSDLNRCRTDLERMRQKFIGKDDEAPAEHLQTILPAKDMEFREM
ncbi:hypothetical protein GIB67_014510 [Kingdonia uniflora]|uniref:Uncharacterized protein n=1 Tax=Kingdonia uniflora TaxID=39325 RepID=A0A7J7NM60_9MAGN|nr:hypothetical protein GIB67_014510 [Kingdonia uniflora]